MSDLAVDNSSRRSADLPIPRIQRPHVMTCLRRLTHAKECCICGVETRYVCSACNTSSPYCSPRHLLEVSTFKPAVSETIFETDFNRSLSQGWDRHDCERDATLTDEVAMYYSLAVTANMVALFSGVLDEDHSGDNWSMNTVQNTASHQIPVARAVRGVLVHPTSSK